MEQLADEQLAAIAGVLSVADRLDAPVWLRGGWAMDFYLGEITRPHVDVDWFAWAPDLPLIASALIAGGWQNVAEHPAKQQRDLVRGVVELGFAPWPGLRTTPWWSVVAPGRENPGRQECSRTRSPVTWPA